MEIDKADKRDEALAFLVGHTSGVLSTVSADGQPRSRLVYYTCDDAFRVYLITLAATRKAADLAANPRAAFVVSEADAPRTIQIEGRVTDLTDTATADPLLANLLHTLMANRKYGAPLERFDPSTLKLYRITPSWVRWGDFTFGEGTDTVLSEIDPVTG